MWDVMISIIRTLFNKPPRDNWHKQYNSVYTLFVYIHTHVSGKQTHAVDYLNICEMNMTRTDSLRFPIKTA